MTHLALQARLQREAYNLDLEAEMTNEDKIQLIKENVLALMDELHEALGEVGWKPWASSRHIIEPQLQSELIDAYHFLMNLMILAGLDDRKVDIMYRAKNHRNLERQLEGYDGVAGKCARCRRALDDLHTDGVISEDTNKLYCSHVCKSAAEGFGTTVEVDLENYHGGE